MIRSDSLKFSAGPSDRPNSSTVKQLWTIGETGQSKLGWRKVFPVRVLYMAKWAVLGRHEKQEREGLAGRER